MLLDSLFAVACSSYHGSFVHMHVGKHYLTLLQGRKETMRSLRYLQTCVYMLQGSLCQQQTLDLPSS